MSFLLDTKVVIWLAGRNPRIRPDVMQALNREADLVVSSASLLEISGKVARQRLHFDEALLSVLSGQVRWLDVTPTHAWRVSSLPTIHLDPFDRLLVAQAMIEGLTLVTGDHLLVDYGVPVLLT